jgi:TfoX/Sxy family transcriptional regulator of competence genes
MASTPEFLDYVRDQLRDAGRIAHRRMFGEYAIYLDGKVVALICRDQLYVKPTASGRALIGTPKEAQPYPGAKPYFLASEHLDDSELMAQLIRVTASELPEPKLTARHRPKAKRGARSKAISRSKPR